MCIICNAATDDGIAFVHEFEQAQRAMKLACSAMLSCSKSGRTPSDKRKYDKTYKRMLKIMRQWNAIEHFREIRPASPQWSP